MQLFLFICLSYSPEISSIDKSIVELVALYLRELILLFMGKAMTASIYEIHQNFSTCLYQLLSKHDNPSRHHTQHLSEQGNHEIIHSVSEDWTVWLRNSSHLYDELPV